MISLRELEKVVWLGWKKGRGEEGDVPFHDVQEKSHQRLRMDWTVIFCLKLKGYRTYEINAK